MTALIHLQRGSGAVPGAPGFMVEQFPAVRAWVLCVDAVALWALCHSKPVSFISLCVLELVGVEGCGEIGASRQAVFIYYPSFVFYCILIHRRSWGTNSPTAPCVLHHRVTRAMFALYAGNVLL